MVLAEKEEQCLFFVIQEESHPNMVSASYFFLGVFVKFCCSLYLGLFGFGLSINLWFPFLSFGLGFIFFFVFAVILRKGVIFTGLHGLKFVMIDRYSVFVLAFFSFFFQFFVPFTPDWIERRLRLLINTVLWVNIYLL